MEGEFGFEYEFLKGTFFTCSVCSYAWRTRSSRNVPRSCPRCGTRLWRQNFKHECCKCGHTWRTSRETVRKCPACQSREWDLLERPYVSREFPEYIRDNIITMYATGNGAVKISIALKLTFSDVFDVLKAVHPGQDIRL